MPRVRPISEAEAPAGVAELFQRIRASFGTIPNIFLAMGNSPAVLKGYIELNSALHQTSLSPVIREKIALAVGQINRCRYCLAAHSTVAKKVGMSDDAISKARSGEDDDPKTQAILNFVRQSVENRGWMTDEHVTVLKNVGVSEREIVEIVMAIAINLFTNYFNHIADPEIDYPVAIDI